MGICGRRGREVKRKRRRRRRRRRLVSPLMASVYQTNAAAAAQIQKRCCSSRRLLLSPAPSWSRSYSTTSDSDDSVVVQSAETRARIHHLLSRDVTKRRPPGRSPNNPHLHRFLPSGRHRLRLRFPSRHRRPLVLPSMKTTKRAVAVAENSSRSASSSDHVHYLTRRDLTSLWRKTLMAAGTNAGVKRGVD